MEFKRNNEFSGYTGLGIFLSMDEYVSVPMYGELNAECVALFPYVEDYKRFIESLFFTIVSESGGESFHVSLINDTVVFPDDYMIVKMLDGENSVVVCFDFFPMREINNALYPGVYYLHISSMQFQSDIFRLNVL